MARTIGRNRLVRVGNGKKVYRVAQVPRPGSWGDYRLAADAKHPDAAKRLPNGCNWFTRGELVPVWP
ncbi:Uncharacterised protein [Mycobacteroides abscessus subsp. abscessus]|nr:hypothetical protein [Mycobacteroides abscessus]SID46308.1 Uncharacterised protein [Mycobacteroides abscessus subsp. abscessus]SIG27821.1 Uncharacterised protein [Mycobacteroides abscessus subsp. abscessus]SIN59337.1 Uncharacterised protein [Mycobacteroides abscessus subsp. abscessus]SKU08605.1 Uncharacterised protein [Mycobacteroides abscessus subsp. abscessus]